MNCECHMNLRIEKNNITLLGMHVFHISSIETYQNIQFMCKLFYSLTLTYLRQN